jgi:DNA mismatch repair ATPase MutS
MCPPELEQLGQTLRSHLVENPPLYLTEGHLIRDGVNAQLDDLRQQISADQAVDCQVWSPWSGSAPASAP